MKNKKVSEKIIEEYFLEIDRLKTFSIFLFPSFLLAFGFALVLDFFGINNLRFKDEVI